jgi:hypothetical protein
MQTRRFATFGTRALAYATYRSLGMGHQYCSPNRNRISLGEHHPGACRSSPGLHRSSEQPLQTFAQKTYIDPVIHKTRFWRCLSRFFQGPSVEVALGSAVWATILAGLWTDFRVWRLCEDLVISAMWPVTFPGRTCESSFVCEGAVLDDGMDVLSSKLREDPRCVNGMISQVL